MPLIGASHGHGVLKVLRIVELDIDPDVFRQPTGEQLRLLVGDQATGVRHARLELVLVCRNGGQKRQPRKVCQMVRSKRRRKMLVTQTFEFLPTRIADIPLEHIIPLLGGTGEVEGSKPDFLGLRCVL